MIKYNNLALFFTILAWRIMNLYNIGLGKTHNENIKNTFLYVAPIIFLIYIFIGFLYKNDKNDKNTIKMAFELSIGSIILIISHKYLSKIFSGPILYLFLSLFISMFMALINIDNDQLFTFKNKFIESLIWNISSNINIYNIINNNIINNNIITKIVDSIFVSLLCTIGYNVVII